MSASVKGASLPRRRAIGATRVVHYAVLIVLLVVMILPLYWMVVTSLRGKGESIFGAVAPFPVHPSFDAYVSVFSTVPVIKYMVNSGLVVVLSVISECVLSAFAGYALSRRGWRGRRLSLGVILAAILFPFESIMVSLFVMVNSLGLIDSLIGVWLPAFVTPVSILIMRAAFLAVPDELEEAAVLDGANEWQRFWRIFAPAARGATVVVGITTFIGAWDNFLWPLLVLRSDSNYTLTLGLAQLSNSELGYNERVVMAGAVISIIPVLIVFGVAQKYFFRGVGAGALKF